MHAFLARTHGPRLRIAIKLECAWPKATVAARNLGRAKLDEEGTNQVAGGVSGAQLRPLPWNRLNILQKHVFWSLSDVILELLENFGLGAPWTCNAMLKLDGGKMNGSHVLKLDGEKMIQVAGGN